MDEAVELLRAFLKAEYDYHLAVFSKPDDILAQCESHVRGYLGPEYELQYQRPPGDFERARELCQQQAEDLSERVLFLVTQQIHPTEGSVFSAIVSSDNRILAGRYGYLLVFSVNDGKAMVRSRYQATFDWDTGSVGGGEWDGWDHTSGERFETLGTVVAFRKLQRPTQKAQALAYDELAVPQASE